MLQRGYGPALPAEVLYDLLRLRAEVFVVEQHCPYLDPDGLDLLPSTEHHWWADAGGTIVAALRVVDDPAVPAARRIGRVVCRAAARGGGLAGTRVRSMVGEQRDGVALTLHAQSHLVGWYEALGFEVDGPPSDEDGILHTPMRRPAPAPAREPAEPASGRVPRHG
jgi:ElaA protein